MAIVDLDGRLSDQADPLIGYGSAVHAFHSLAVISIWWGGDLSHFQVNCNTLNKELNSLLWRTHVTARSNSCEKDNHRAD